MERKAATEMEKGDHSLPCNAAHLGALSKTRSQAIKLVMAPCGDTDVAMTDKSVLAPGVLGAVYSVWSLLVCFIWTREDDHI